MVVLGRAMMGRSFGPEGVNRPIRISVIGAGDASPEEESMAEAVGRALAESGAVVVTGGLGGVMAAASRGCVEAGGVAIGILPGRDPSDANPWVTLPLATGLGEARNALVVGTAEAVVAVGGGWGTLSEIALARKLGHSVVLLGKPPADVAVPRASDPEEAAAWALHQAGERRKGGPAPIAE
jgi:uncharacterized protein (TIGR00725 family)